MHPPKATIVITTYNRAPLLERALGSALDQTYPELEIVVADDCSTDDTPDVVARLADRRLVYYRQPRNIGAANWGKGLELASGTYVSFLGDDDALGPTFIAERVRLMQEFGATVVFTGHQVCDISGQFVRLAHADLGPVRPVDGRELVKAALSRTWFLLPSLYRRDACLEVWPQVREDGFVFDVGLNVRLALTPGMIGVYAPLSDYAMSAHDGQISNSRREIVFEQTTALLERILEQLRDDPRAALVKRELASWHTVWARSLASEGELNQARSHLARAVRTAPRQAWPWKQLIQAALQPRRFIASAQAGVRA